MVSMVLGPFEAGAVTTFDFGLSGPLWRHLEGTTLSYWGNAALVGPTMPEDDPKPKIIKTVLTAYSSSPDETDDSPFITASGSRVRDGIVATNALPMGTQVRIPEIYGDKIFVVEDRMARRFHDRMDIWMPTKREAIIFGKIIAEIEIVEIGI